MSRRVVGVALMVLVGFVATGARASFVLSGQVVTETGAPVEGASVKVTKSRSGYEQGLRWLDGEPEPDVLDATVSWSAGATGEDGLFELALPGLEELTLRADAGDGRWVTEAFDALEEETLVLELPEPTVLSGRVSGAATGESLGGALVFRDRSGRVAETGDYGRYGLAFSEPVDNERVQAVVPGHRLSGVRVPMPPAGDLSFVLEPVSSLRGRVVTRSGAPVAGATVRLVRHPAELHLGF